MATHSWNTTLGYGPNTTLVGEIISIDPGVLKASATKTTHLTSTGAHHTKIPGLVEPGQIKMEINYVKATANTLKGLLTARTNQTWTITFPDGSTWASDGFLAELGRGKVDEDDRITNSVTIELSGQSTFTPAA